MTDILAAIGALAVALFAALRLLPDAPLTPKPIADKTPAQTVAKPNFIARLIARLFKGRKA